MQASDFHRPTQRTLRIYKGVCAEINWTEMNCNLSSVQFSSVQFSSFRLLCVGLRHYKPSDFRPTQRTYRLYAAYIRNTARKEKVTASIAHLALASLPSFLCLCYSSFLHSLRCLRTDAWLATNTNPDGLNLESVSTMEKS